MDGPSSYTSKWLQWLQAGHPLNEALKSLIYSPLTDSHPVLGTKAIAPSWGGGTVVLFARANPLQSLA